MVGTAVIRLGLMVVGNEDLLDVKAVTVLPVVGLCWAEVLTKDVVGGCVGVRGARVFGHIAKSIVT